jgi:hypothetical protein
MKLAQIRRYRAWVKSCTQDSRQYAEVILELCDEIERLQGVTDEKHGNYTNFTLMPFGVHKGKKLVDLPDDYIQWWRGMNPDRGAIQVERDFGKFSERRIAEQKLKLFDYFNQRFGESSNGHTNRKRL